MEIEFEFFSFPALILCKWYLVLSLGVWVLHLVPPLQSILYFWDFSEWFLTSSIETPPAPGKNELDGEPWRLSANASEFTAKAVKSRKFLASSGRVTVSWAEARREYCC